MARHCLALFLVWLAPAAGQSSATRPAAATRTASFYYRGKCQSAVANFPFSTPSVAAPTFSCINSGSAVMAVASWANNTSNQSVQDQFLLPTGFSGDVTVEVTGRSADAAHASMLVFSWACVGSGAIENPVFTPALPVRFTGSAANIRTVTSAVFSTACAAGQDLYWKLVADTTALTGGATFDLVALRFTTAALQ